MVDHLVRIVGVADEDVALDLAQLGLANPEPLTADLALRAGLLRARHYHRGSRAKHDRGMAWHTLLVDGFWLHMSPAAPHSLVASEPTVMLLTLFGS